ncbi:hypothetical protein, partial [Malikia spinosa]|uniref:hypothetical protein n=1 Tax=Malikia spinosa TaxID=86180 RepID=UPI0027B89D74
PTLIGCIFLTIHPLGDLSSPHFVFLAAISEALNYDTVSCVLIKKFEDFFKLLDQPEAEDWVCCVGKEIIHPPDDFLTANRKIS